MNRLIATALGLCLTLACLAQADSTKAVKQKKERTIQMNGQVFDSFTKAALEAKMTLLKSDSTVVDTTTCYRWTWGTSNCFYTFNVSRQPERYIIKAVSEGYEDTYLNYDVKNVGRKQWLEVPRILMKKRADENAYTGGDLDDVVVTGTKVKIVYKGDTIIYNASAFNVPEGSMLDGLVRQMPGVELKDNGDIYVNGKKVDYLTLNGSDFFKGQNKVMLENLPHYTVQNIKVYDKPTEESRMLGKDIAQKDYVMDVILKREYNRGYMANTEAGYGTHDRYLARMFGLYFDDHTRASVYANTNNINEDRRPGEEGEWSPAESPQGLKTTHTVGFSLATEDADKRLNLRNEGSLTWQDDENETRSASERFAEAGNISRGSESWSRQKDFRFENNGVLSHQPLKLGLSYNISYYNGHRDAHSSDSTFQSAIINRTFSESYNRYARFSSSLGGYWFKELPWGDHITLDGTGRFQSNKPSESFSNNLTQYAQTGTDDLRRRYIDSHSHSYSYSLSAGYTLALLNNWNFELNHKFVQDYSNSTNDNYRLDWLLPLIGDQTGTEQEQETAFSRPLRWLPSNDLLLQAIDAPNSNEEGEMGRTHTSRLSIYQSKELKGGGWQYVRLQLPVEFLDERLHYVQPANLFRGEERYDTVVQRSYKTFEPSLTLYRSTRRQSISMDYRMSVSAPSLSALVPNDDTTNPLYTRINNPNMKNSHRHSMNIHYRHTSDSLKQTVALWANGSTTRNAWGTRTLYDKETGAYTYMQDNINGNWNVSAGWSWERPVDRKKHLRFYQRNDASLNHNVDFAITNVGPTTSAGITETGKSAVNTATVSEHLRFTYELDKLTIGLGGNVDWRHSTSDREGFQTIDTYDFDYGLTAKYTVPVVKIDLGTDLKMFSRRGYESDIMNYNKLIWNASVSKAFAKGKVVAKLTAFDIFHNTTTTDYSINAQGYTETWHNSIPSYALLTLAYKFQKMPKGRR
ncbi:MAG: outer membrane beta-barrel protein [Prevotella sp.]|nr:outer membrane beta-barrel protein [Prevotella sp.]